MKLFLFSSCEWMCVCVCVVFIECTTLRLSSLLLFHIVVCMTLNWKDKMKWKKFTENERRKTERKNGKQKNTIMNKMNEATKNLQCFDVWYFFLSFLFFLFTSFLHIIAIVFLPSLSLAAALSIFVIQFGVLYVPFDNIICMNSERSFTVCVDRRTLPPPLVPFDRFAFYSRNVFETFE